MILSFISGCLTTSFYPHLQPSCRQHLPFGVVIFRLIDSSPWSTIQTKILTIPWRPPALCRSQRRTCWVEKIEHLLRLVRNLWSGNAGTNSSVFQAHNALTDETAKANYEKWACGMWWQRCLDSLLCIICSIFVHTHITVAVRYSCN